MVFEAMSLDENIEGVSVEKSGLRAGQVRLMKRGQQKRQRGSHQGYVGQPGDEGPWEPREQVQGGGMAGAKGSR